MGTAIVLLVAACLLGMGEMHTGGFFLGPFAIGALIGAVLGFAGAGAAASLIVFALVSLLVLGMLRPLAVGTGGCRRR